MKNSTFHCRVYYEDTDFSGFVYHARYLHFMERARTEFLREMGIEQNQMYERENVGFVVQNLNIQYMRPARMDDLLVIETKVENISGASFTLNQQIMRNSVILTQSSVKIACIKNGRATRLPAQLAEKIKQ